MLSERPFISTDEERNALVFALQEQLDAVSGSVGIEDAHIQQSIEDNIIEGKIADFGSKVVPASSDWESTSEWKAISATTIGGPRWIYISTEEPPTLTSLLSEDPSIGTFRIPLTTTASSAEITTTFQELVDEWRSQTEFYSSIIDIATHPAYQRIIGMGRTAIPLILQELSKQPDHWFWALKAITGEDPVHEQDQGDLVKMRTAWLAWGAANGYDI